jgi:hypothetical protein
VNEVAESYVKLNLAVGRHDPHYVDAYYGPPDWKAEVDSQAWDLSEIRERALVTKDDLSRYSPSEEMEALRGRFLGKQLDALIAWVGKLSGERLSFDEESAAIYDVVDEGKPDSYYQSAIDRLNAVLPGSGDLMDRFAEIRDRFIVPQERLEEVFAAAIDAAREKTKRFIALPDSETFEVELVKGEVWGAYNWYKGNAHSLIQLNTDFPSIIDQAIPLACHEGYPGHHVYNALLEEKLYRQRGWMEFTVYALFSPQSLIAEGTAEYGIELMYPPEERRQFEREVLLPLAGLDPAGFEEFSEARKLVKDLGRSGIDAGRRYLDGHATREETIEWLCRYGLTKPDRSEQRVRFIEANRSYVVTYVVGEQMVRNYVERLGSTEAERWRVFESLLDSPRTPSGLLEN